MFEPSKPSSAAGLSIAEPLQKLTELLAAAQTQEEVLTAALNPAMSALGAVAGAVLLLDLQTKRLSVAALQGHGAQTVWQDGPLSPQTPAGDALSTRQALYFEHAGTLKAAYPHLEEQTGGVTAVATALLPLMLAEQPLGVLILDFREPHTFTPDEKRFLTSLSSQSAVAISRSQLIATLDVQMRQRTEALEAEQQALRAFVAFSRATAETTDVHALAEHAAEVLQAVLQDVSVVYYERAGDLWQARGWSDGLTPEVVGVIRAGLPVTAPRFAAVVASRAPLFIPNTDTAEGGTEAENDGATALFPCLVEGQVQGVLSMGTEAALDWSARDRQVFGAVGSSLTLALERVEASRQLLARQEGAERRSQVLEAFAALSAEMSVQQQPTELIQRSQEIVLSLLPEGHALYWEQVGGLWRCRAQTGEVGNPELQAAIDAGIPVGRLPTIDGPWQSGEPEYQNRYAAGRDLAFTLTDHIQSVAALPIYQGETMRGVMNFTAHGSHVWRAVDQVVLETVQQSLSLALDRLHQQGVIQRQRDEAEQRSRALEAFAVLSRDLAQETSRFALIRRAQEIMLSLLTSGYSLYWEEAGDHWALKAQVGDIGDPALQRLVDEQGLPLEAPALHQTWLTGMPNYQDNYAQGADTPAELIRHVQAATAFRVEVQGRPVGMLAIGLFDQRLWTPMDRATLETAVYSLGLVLERAQSIETLAERTLELEERTRMLAERTDQLEHSNAQLEHSNDELLASNSELEAFTYSASHDLRTPVRHVMGFAELAQKALEKNQETKAQQHLEVIKEGALRMTALIDGMLVLSRSGRQELNVRAVDLNALVTQGRRDAAAEFGTHPVRWHIGELPTVQGDPQLLQQVMTNLMSNAVKYSARREVSEVGVECEERAAEWRISVADNGVGFDPNYTGKLFGIFQRLHNERVFKGTGVGLATVKRIVQKHGGRVFAESDGQTGATFGFTLPRPN